MGIRRRRSRAWPLVAFLALIASVLPPVTRVELSSDGLSVVSSVSLLGGFEDPLPMAQGPDGTLYVGEFDQSNIFAGVITALIRKAGC